MVTRRLWILTIAGVALAGCGLPFGGSAESSDDSSAGTAPERSAAVLPPTEPATPETTEAPPRPPSIEATLVRSTDDTVIVPLLERDPDPSPIDGDVVPAPPDARCAVAARDRWDERVDLVGCEFNTLDAATDYAEQWSAAFSIKAPQWYGQPAKASAVKSVPDWTGRMLSTKVPGDDAKSFRVDLVQQVGIRVFTITSVNPQGQRKAAVQKANAVAKAQQSFLETNGIDAATPPSDSPRPKDVSVRYLTPTWAELAALAPSMTGPPEEWFRTYDPDDDGAPTPEQYSRILASAKADEWGSRDHLTATVTRHDTVEDARRSVLDDTGLDCIGPPGKVKGSPNTIACTMSWQSVVTARHDNFTLTIKVPEGIDRSAAEQLFKKWNTRFIKLELPTINKASPLKAVPRTKNPLPSDEFPPGGFDGSYFRTYFWAWDEGGKYTSVQASYTKTPGFIGQPYQDDRYDVVISRNDEDIEPRGDSFELVGTIGKVTPDEWTTVVWRSVGDGVEEISSFDAAMMRELPSGDRIEVRDSYMSIYPAVDEPDPPFDAEGPLLATIWDTYQGFSLTDFKPDPDDIVAVRSVAWMVIARSQLSSGDEFSAAIAAKTPDSPPGTVAEWHLLGKSFDGSGRTPPPETDRQLIAFSTKAKAKKFVADATQGLEMTPIEGVGQVEAGFNAEAGLVVLRRGKWAMRVSSPGRTSWGDGYESPDNPIPIDRYARDLADYLDASGLV